MKYASHLGHFSTRKITSLSVSLPLPSLLILHVKVNLWTIVKFGRRMSKIITMKRE